MFSGIWCHVVWYIDTNILSSFVDVCEEKDIMFLSTNLHDITDQKILILKCTALKMPRSFGFLLLFFYLYFVVISSSLIYKWKFACTWLGLLWGETLRRMWISLSKLCTLGWFWWSGHPESCYFWNMSMQQCVNNWYWWYGDITLHYITLHYMLQVISKQFS
jgi:hypothetical protein